MENTFMTQRLIEHHGNFRVELTGEQPCPSECLFLEHLGIQRIEPAEDYSGPSRLTEILMNLVGRKLEEPEVEYRTSQQCKFMAFVGGYPMESLVATIDSIYPHGEPPQEFGCPADIMINVIGDNFEVTLGEIQLPSLPIERE